jgi:heterodisulfide reductase subunit B2
VKYAYYPGCSIETSARMYETSLRRVFELLDVELEELDDWSCCGATAAHTLDHAVATGLSARNLGLAERAGLDVVTPCASCFFRLRAAESAMRDERLAARVNEALPAPYRGKTRVLNVLEALLRAVDAREEPPAVVRTFGTLRPVCYYGCLFVRAAGDVSYDDREDPTAMERLLRGAGIEPVDWGCKIDCCGASAAITDPALAGRLQGSILEDARVRGANALVTACPMCQINLDMGQAGRTQPGLPVFFLTQLLGLAWGFSDAEMEVDRLLAPPDAVAQVLG